MELESDFTLTKFDLGETAALLRTTWTPNSVSFFMTDGANVWERKVHQDNIEESLCPKDMSFTSFLQLLRDCLGVVGTDKEYESPSALNLSFGGESPPSCNLSWRLRNSHESFAIKGEIQLLPHDDGPAAIRSIVESHTRYLSQLHAQFMGQQARLDKLQSRVFILEPQVSSLQEIKGDMHRLFVAPFAALLNSKKEKIRELKEKISQLEAQGPSSAPPRDDEDKDEDIWGADTHGSDHEREQVLHGSALLSSNSLLEDGLFAVPAKRTRDLLDGEEGDDAPIIHRPGVIKRRRPNSGKTSNGAVDAPNSKSPTPESRTSSRTPSRGKGKGRGREKGKASGSDAGARRNPRRTPSINLSDLIDDAQ